MKGLFFLILCCNSQALLFAITIQAIEDLAILLDRFLSICSPLNALIGFLYAFPHSLAC